MTTTARTGQLGTCPECGSHDYYRVDEVKSGSRWNAATVWEDGTVTLDDESGDIEAHEIVNGEWACVNDHRVSDDSPLAAALDALEDGEEVVDLTEVGA